MLDDQDEFESAADAAGRSYRERISREEELATQELLNDQDEFEPAGLAEAQASAKMLVMGLTALVLAVGMGLLKWLL